MEDTERSIIFLSLRNLTYLWEEIRPDVPISNFASLLQNAKLNANEELQHSRWAEQTHLDLLNLLLPVALNGSLPLDFKEDFLCCCNRHSTASEGNLVNLELPCHQQKSCSYLRE